MAKHRRLKQQRRRRALLAGAATTGVSAAIALVQPTITVDTSVGLTADNTVIGIGGRDDTTSARIPAKLSGTLVPNPDTYTPILYPASLDLGGSRDAGVGPLDDAIHDPNDTTPISVVGYSEGTLVEEQERRNLQANPGAAPAAGDLHFTQIASPFAGNGGLFSRFAGVPTFLIVDNMGPAQPTRYDTDYVVNEYDPYGDFPAYLNPLSLANSLLAVEYAHPDAYYDAIEPGVTPQLGTTKTVQNSAGGTDTYTLYYNDHLPLFGPVRQLASAVGITPITEIGLGLLEPEFRVLVDMGYTDRTNADPATPVAFSLITPPAKILEAVEATPGALGAGVQNGGGGGQAINPLTVPSPSPSPNVSSTSAATPAPKKKPLAITPAPSLISPVSALLHKPVPTVVAGSSGPAGSPTNTASSGGLNAGKVVAGAVKNTGSGLGATPPPA